MNQISFKILSTEEIIHDGIKSLLVKVSNCSKPSVQQIILPLFTKKEDFLQNGKGKSFLVKFLISTEDNEKLVIEDSNYEIFENEFRFNVEEISDDENNKVIKIRNKFSASWNGKENFKRIHLLIPDNEKRDNVFQTLKSNLGKSFTIKNIKNFRWEEEEEEEEEDFVLLIDKFGKVEPTNELFGPIWIEVKIIDWKTTKRGNYLINCQIKNNELKNYQRVKISFDNKKWIKLNKNEEVKIRIEDIFVVLQRSENDVLRINQDFTDFTLLTGKDQNSSDKERSEVKQKIKNFLDQYDWEKIAEKITRGWKRLNEHHHLFNKVFEKLPDLQGKELANNYSQLVIKLKEAKDKQEVQSLIKKKEESIFLDNEDYQNKEKLAIFSQQLDDWKKSLSKLEEQLIEYEESIEIYLQEKWNDFLALDNQLTDFLTKHGINPAGLIYNLVWYKNYFWWEEKKAIDYPKLESWLNEEKKNNRLPDSLGYLPKEKEQNSDFYLWSQANISKKEAMQAQILDYSISQWKDSRYEEYKKRKQSRITADEIINFLNKYWNPSLTNQEQEKIKTSLNSKELVKNLQEIWQQKNLFLAKNHAKSLIKQTLENRPLVEKHELDIAYQNYESIIEERKSLESLKNYCDQTVKEINRVRQKKETSLAKAKTNAANNIANTFKKTKINLKNLDPQHRNYLKKISRSKSVEEVHQFEQELIIFLNDIQQFSQQTWLFPFQQNKIYHSKNKESLRKLIEKLEKSQEIQLITSQLNQHCQAYNDLLNRKEQNYNLQKKKLITVQELIAKIQELRELNQIEEEVHEETKKVSEKLENLVKIKLNEEKFNSLGQKKEKEETLQKIQKQFSKLKDLTQEEKKNQAKVTENLTLLQNNHETKFLPIINERQQAISLLTPLAEEVWEDNEEEVGTINDQDWEKWQKNALIISFFLVLIFIIYRWWKKRREDPFV